MKQTDRLPHALLIHGSKGTGIKHFASLVSASLLCEEPLENGKQCGNCKSCHLFIAKTHPELLVVQPEEENQAIKVEQIREAVTFSQLQSHYDHRKIILIHKAEVMNDNAANSLLKTLEEPPGETLIILTSSYPSLLPITVRSRCQKLKISASPREVREWLEGRAEPEQVNSILASGSGPLVFEESATLENFPNRSDLLKDLENMASGSQDPLITAGNWATKDVNELFICLMTLLQDTVKLKTVDNIESTHVVSPDTYLSNCIMKISKLIDIKGLMRAYDKAFECRKLLARNTTVKPLTICEEFTLEWTRLGKG